MVTAGVDDGSTGTMVVVVVVVTMVTQPTVTQPNMMATDMEPANATRASTRHRQGGGRGPVGVRPRPLGVPGYAGANLTPLGRQGETEGDLLRREGGDPDVAWLHHRLQEQRQGRGR